jgi:hypothetical protein
MYSVYTMYKFWTGFPKTQEFLPLAILLKKSSHLNDFLKPFSFCFEYGFEVFIFNLEMMVWPPPPCLKAGWTGFKCQDFVVYWVIWESAAWCKIQFLTLRVRVCGCWFLGGCEGGGVHIRESNMYLHAEMHICLCTYILFNPPSAEEFFFEFVRENRVWYSYKPLEIFVFIRFFILHF